MLSASLNKTLPSFVPSQSRDPALSAGGSVRRTTGAFRTSRGATGTTIAVTTRTSGRRTAPCATRQATSGAATDAASPSAGSVTSTTTAGTTAMKTSPRAVSSLAAEISKYVRISASVV